MECSRHDPAHQSLADLNKRTFVCSLSSDNQLLLPSTLNPAPCSAWGAIATARAFDRNRPRLNDVNGALPPLYLMID